MNRTFLVKIIPPGGYDVYRLQFGRRHLAAAIGTLLVLLVAAVGYHAWQIRQADAKLHELEALTSAQREKLSTIDKQADTISTQLRRLQRENDEIRALMGADRRRARAAHDPAQHAAVPPAADLAAVQARIAHLARVAQERTAEEHRLKSLALRVLNTRRLAAIARARVLAAIPSLNPVDGGIAAGFGWRTDPWPEFHKGLDLAADYGTTVRASAAGTVVSAGWDPGGFGNKIDVDHGNGYHTWYAHLSRVAVTTGQTVAKGEPIGFVGSTGESTGPHLHYQVMKDGNPIDPAPFLGGVPKTILATLPDDGTVR